MSHLKKVKKRRSDGIAQAYWMKHFGAGMLIPEKRMLAKIAEGDVEKKEARTYLEEKFNPREFGLMFNVPKNEKQYAKGILQSWEAVE